MLRVYYRKPRGKQRYQKTDLKCVPTAEWVIEIKRAPLVSKNGRGER